MPSACTHVMLSYCGLCLCLPLSTAQVVASLMRAVNKREKEDALKFLNVLLMSEADIGSVDMHVNQRKPEPLKVVKEFTYVGTFFFIEEQAFLIKRTVYCS